MKAGIGLAATCAGVFLALLLQQALPPIDAFQGARFVFVPLIFCLAAMALPFPLMLAAAFFTGFLCDLMYLHVVEGRVEIALGCSIVFFVIYGSIANGLRPSYLQGHWWPLVPLAGGGTAAYLLMQFVLISLRRQGFEFDPAVLWRVLAPGCIAAIFAPILYAAVKPFGAMLSPGSETGRNY
jgi:hypothetical protein